MSPEHIVAAIRPRSHWEGVDLGFALARRWFLPLWSQWWMTAAPIALLTALLLREHVLIWSLLVWWLKPLYEAPLLSWLGRALFADQQPLAAAARRLPAALPARLWPQLLWRRLSPLRSYTMPVTLLERLRGSSRRARLRALGGGSSTAGWLTLISAHFEAILWLSAVLLIAIMTPAPMDHLDVGAALFDETAAVYWIGLLCWLAAISIIAPFYVAGGFALYLRQRTELEAWDLELCFRQTAALSERGPDVARARHRASATRGAPTHAAALAAVVLLLPGLMVARPADASVTTPTPERARAVIEEILDGPDFGHSEERDVWRFTGDLDESQRIDAESDQWPWANGPFLWLARLVKWALIIAAAAAVALLAYKIFEDVRTSNRPRGRVKETSQPRASRLVGGRRQGPIRLAEAVHDLLGRGDTRGALSLLYRVQLEALRDAGIDISDSATEAECLAAATASSATPQRIWLERLTRLWQRLAYAHLPVSSEEVLELLSTRPGAALRR